MKRWLGLLGMMAWGVAAAQEAPSYNVLLITVDCLRPDHMGVYGYERNNTPYLSSIAEESAVFTEAFATSGWTSPGIISFFTGYYPPTHAQNGQHSWWGQHTPTALSLMSQDGYRTAGKTHRGPTLEGIGLDLSIGPYGHGPEFIANRSEPWAQDKRFFGWIHIKPTHLPYNAGSPYYRQMYGVSEISGPAQEAVFTQGVLYAGQQDFRFSEEDIAVTRSLYDASVAAADQEVGEMIEQLRAGGLLDKTIVVISADHGEELFEHGWLGHASTSWTGKLFDENIHIPLIVRFPEGQFAGRYDQIVQQTDLMPTLYELMGRSEEALPVPMQGVSLMPLLRGETTEAVRPYAFAQTTYKGWATPVEEMSDRITAVRSPTLKLLRYGGERADELVGYDLAVDPAEQAPIVASEDPRFAPLHEAMRAWDEQTTADARTVAEHGQRAALEALREARRQGDRVGALHTYAGLVRVDATFRMEVSPFTEQADAARSWARGMRQAQQEMLRALGEP